MPENNDSELLQTVVRFFDDQGWNYDRIEGRPVLTMNFQTGAVVLRSIAIVDDQREQFQFLTMPEVKAPPEHRATVAELLTRINYRIALGNFEMDWDDGALRYRMTISVRDGRLTVGMVRTMVLVSVSTVERCFPALMAVMFAGKSPAVALAEMEDQEASES